MAGAFVLGEVLALRNLTAGAGVLMLLGIGALVMCAAKGCISLNHKRLMRSFGVLWIALLAGVLCAAVRGGETAQLPDHGAGAVIRGELTRMELKNEWLVCYTAGNRVESDGCLFSAEKLLSRIKMEDQRGELKVGMQVEISGSISWLESPRNPGEFDYKAYYLGQKVEYSVWADSIEAAGDGYSPLLQGLFLLRREAAALLDRIAEPGDAGILKAVLLGDKASMDEEVRELYQVNGIAHLLAISGLHISFLGAGAYKLSRKLGAGFAAAGIAGAVLTVSYGLMVGGTASVIRASVMLLLIFWAEYLGRTYDLLSAAALSAVLILADSPHLLGQAGFQLSFGAVLAIGGPGRLLAAWWRESKPEGRGRRRAEAVWMSLAVQWVTGPVVLYHYFQYPVYGIVLNLLVIPLMSYVVISGLLALAGGAIVPALGILALGPGHYILRMYEGLCHFFGDFPFSNLILGRPKAWQMVLYYSFMAAVLIGIQIRLGVIRSMDESQEEEEKQGGARLKWQYGKVMVVVLFSAVLMLSWPVSGMEVLFLDVGQGDGILIRTKEVNILIDGGSTDVKKLGEQRLEPCLKSFGISRLDYVFVSHGDTDHISGIEYILAECPEISIGTLILPGEPVDEVYERLAESAASRGAKVEVSWAGQRRDLGGILFTCLHPSEEYQSDSRNNSSQVLLMEYGQLRVLLTGDVEAGGEQWLTRTYGKDLEALPIQVLKIAHHGSKNSTTDVFLEAVRPRWAVISYGAGNSYGHPSKEVLKRLEDVSCEIYRTADSGAIILRTDGKIVRWETFIK